MNEQCKKSGGFWNQLQGNFAAAYIIPSKKMVAATFRQAAATVSGNHCTPLSNTSNPEPGMQISI
jgi:hypothetical protein